MSSVSATRRAGTGSTTTALTAKGRRTVSAPAATGRRFHTLTPCLWLTNSQSASALSASRSANSAGFHGSHDGARPPSAHATDASSAKARGMTMSRISDKGILKTNMLGCGGEMAWG